MTITLGTGQLAAFLFVALVILHRRRGRRMARRQLATPPLTTT